MDLNAELKGTFKTKVTKRPKAGGTKLLESALNASEAAQDYLFKVMKRDHWVAELESNASITAEYVFLYQALGLEIEPTRREHIAKYLFSRQKQDGSWGIAWNIAGDVSTTVEAYFALKLLGFENDEPRLRAAAEFIRANGGIERIRIFTRINLALFGLFPWTAIPVIPPEFILFPPQSPVNIYNLSSWARGTMVPLFIIFHHKPIFALPNGRSEKNDWLDHLWLDSARKHIPYCPPPFEVMLEHGLLNWKMIFNGADIFLRLYEKVQIRSVPKYVREYAVKRCEEWVLQHQEKSGDWAGIFPPMINSVLALHLNGYSLDSDPVRLGLHAIEKFGFEDTGGFRIEACQSPVWDTILAMIGLLDSGVSGEDENLQVARRWITRKQLLVNYGDWKVYNPTGRSGGWSFEYSNTWYPDVDDTAAVVIGFLKQAPQTHDTTTVRRAVEWLVSMQNDDGGWAAFDRNNDKLYLNHIPFSDMDSLCDPSSPDVTGRVLEALGILDDSKYEAVCARGVEYLRQSQEKEGSWFGRWGVNYVYGTSNVLCSLSRQNVSGEDAMVERALNWLRFVQNDDGGWGEGLESYADKSLMGKGPSTASQTAWAVMGLLAYVSPSDPAVRRGIKWLVDRQLKDGPDMGSWHEEEFTGTGFPKHFYIRYHLYRHYFPLMALGRFCKQRLG